MNKLIFVIFLLLAPAALQAVDSLPVALLFPVTAGEKTDASCAVETTQAIKTYMRQIGKADITSFDPDSPLIKRAILEHRIKAEDMGTASTPDSRLQLATRIGTDLAISGDVFVLDDKVTVSLWIAQVQAKKITRIDASARFLLEGNRNIAISNAIQSATSSVVYKLADEVLKDVKAKPETTQPAAEESTNSPLVEPDYNNQPKNDAAGELVKKAEQFVNNRDLANAILTYRAAVNADPRNVDLRIRLIGLYIERKMFSQAFDEIERAQALDPNNEDLRTELAKVYEARGTPEKAAEIYANVAEANPNDIEARIKAGDFQWQQNNYDEAEKQYRLASQVDVTDPSPYARLALLYASKSMYKESLTEISQVQKVSSKAELKSFTDNYYGRFLDVSEKDLVATLSQLDGGALSFSRKEVTREAYYDLVRGLGNKAKSIAALLQALTPPEDKVSVNRHKILGCSLLSQSCASMLRYLETNKASEKEDSEIFLSEARKHILAD